MHTLSVSRRQLLAAAALTALSGCATRPPAAVGPSVSADASYAGRLSLVVDKEPPQSFIATFRLQGQPGRGTLDLFSPLGSTVAQVRWDASGAVAQQGKMAREYPSLDDLIVDVTGANVPVTALFDWLRGRPTQVPGWVPDLSRQAQGRIGARRQQPLPTATLQVILDGQP